MAPSLLDTDLYKWTMMYAVWEKHPDDAVSYRFINRRAEDRFNLRFLTNLRSGIETLGAVSLTHGEIEWLRSLGLFGEPFLDYLADFRLDPSNVRTHLSSDGHLQLEITGLWHETILWEVPLMALICDCYYSCVDTEWECDLTGVRHDAHSKGAALAQAGCPFIEFGTRRRRAKEVQASVLKGFLDLPEKYRGCFRGTSNTFFARKFGIPAIGTMAHEWIMGYAGLAGVQGANQRSLESWCEIFGDQLSIALTDTYTTEHFLAEFSGPLARRFNGVRQDSGSPFDFVDRIVRFYEGEGIDPKSRQVVFSDGLTTDRALEVQDYAGTRVRAAYGIGTHFTNDFANSPALNIVIKLHSINGRSVAKLSDEPTKASGDESAVREARRAVGFETSV